MTALSDCVQHVYTQKHLGLLYLKVKPVCISSPSLYPVELNTLQLHQNLNVVPVFLSLRLHMYGVFEAWRGVLPSPAPAAHCGQVKRRHQLGTITAIHAHRWVSMTAGSAFIHTQFEEKVCSAAGNSLNELHPFPVRNPAVKHGSVHQFSIQAKRFSAVTCLRLNWCSPSLHLSAHH